MSLTGTCPYPFIPLRNYPETGGDVNGRFCTPIPTTDGFPYCCLPCPKDRFFYPDNFTTAMNISTYINLAGVVFLLFLLLSFAVLPVEYTHRHYLSVCLTFAIMLMQISFVIPLGDKNLCYDKITPHDMYSSTSCALSGAFLLGGAWCSIIWVLIRTLSLHLQICWQVIPGRRFFLASQAVGWSIPIVFLAIVMAITGVSFRFGESCHINSQHGLQTFWGPILAFAAACIVMQGITFGYCVHVYLRSLFEEHQTTTTRSGTRPSSPLPYTNSTAGTVTAIAALRRIQRVIALQWRGILVIIIILIDVIFFATIFLQFDNTTQKSTLNIQHGLKWLQCILEHDGDKDQCLDVASQVVVSEAKALSVLFMLACNGVWAVVLLGRLSILKGWVELFKSHIIKKKPNDEFVSFNARRLSESDPSYEMLDAKRDTVTSIPPSTLRTSMVKAPEPSLTSVRRDHFAPREYNPQTFSSELRSQSNIADREYSPYGDLDSISRSPPLASSPYMHKDFVRSRGGSVSSAIRKTSIGSGVSAVSGVTTPPDSPFADPVAEERSRGALPAYSPDRRNRSPEPSYQPDVKIGFAQ